MSDEKRQGQTKEAETDGGVRADSAGERPEKGAVAGAGKGAEKVRRTEGEWRQLLTPAQYHVLRERGTEPPFSAPAEVAEVAGVGHGTGDRVYQCAGCGAELFDSTAKYNSGSGWPSFFQPLGEGRLATETDVSHGMQRTEIRCARCDGHLGHVFPDGPRPTGQRYCVNGLSLRVAKKGE
jgi:peptide-methionine (R)-S-oxide reductase